MSFTSSFESLVRQHYRTAYAVAFAIMRDHADAEDVCHDAFVKAGSNLEQCRDISKFAQWLCTIVRNEARNTLDKKRVRRSESLDGAEQVGSSGMGIGLGMGDWELRDRLRAALNQLSEVQRTVVLLHDMDGLSHDDIALQIDTSAGMSRQHLFKARQKLRELLGATYKEYRHG